MTPFITDRKEGFWNRTLLAGVSFKEMLLAQTIVFSIVMLLVYIELVAYAAIIYETTNYLCLITLFALLSTLGISGMFIGIGLSTICPNITCANMLMMALSLMMLTVGGVFFAVEFMSDFMQILSRSLPLTIPSEAMRDIMIKGFSFSDPSVLKGFSVAFVWMILGVSCGTWVLKTRKFSRNSV